MPDTKTQLHYLEMAKAESRRSTCLYYQYGAIIVKKNHIVSAGHNGSPHNCPECTTIGNCMLDRYGIEVSAHARHCPIVDAEINAIIDASWETILYGSLFVYGWDIRNNRMIPNLDSSTFAKRIIVNSGLEEVIYADPKGVGRHDVEGIHYGYRVVKVDDLVKIVEREIVEEFKASAQESTKL